MGACYPKQAEGGKVMKKIYKYLLAGLVLLSCGISAFSDAPAIKPDSKKVIFVGKINVIYDENRDFIFKTRGLPDSCAEKPDTYIVPYVEDPSDTFGGNRSTFVKENQTEYTVGETFIVQIRRLKKTPNTFKFSGIFNMNFFGSDRAMIYLPLPAAFEVDVPNDIQAIYLGTFNYYVTGDNFTIHNFERVDEYDTAQEELDRRLGKHCDMARAVLKAVDEEK